MGSLVTQSLAFGGAESDDQAKSLTGSVTPRDGMGYGPGPLA